MFKTSPKIEMLQQGYMAVLKLSGLKFCHLCHSWRHCRHHNYPTLCHCLALTLGPSRLGSDRTCSMRKFPTQLTCCHNWPGVRSGCRRSLPGAWSGLACFLCQLHEYDPPGAGIFLQTWLFNFSGYSLADGHFLCERRERISLKNLLVFLILLSKREKFISLGLWSECQTERDLPLPRLGSRCKVFIQTVVISGLLSVPTAWLRPSRGRYFYRQSPYLACCLYQLHTQGGRETLHPTF